MARLHPQTEHLVMDIQTGHDTLPPAMTEADEAAFVAGLEAEFMLDDDSASRAHLAAGRAIYYRRPDTPSEHVIREYPGGRRELVRVSASRRFYVVEGI